MKVGPWRKVVGMPIRYAGRGSTIGPDTSRRGRWWRLLLECEHEVERAVRYLPLGAYASRGGTQHRSGQDVLPAPTKVRCELCPKEGT